MYSVKSRLTIIILFYFIISPFFANAQQGLEAEYFNDIEFKNLVLKRRESKPYLNFLKQAPAPGVNKEYFSVRWTGNITPPESGDYVFSAKADDGIRLWIDEKIIIESWRDQEATAYKGSVFLEKDKQYKLKLEYYNSILHSVLSLSWETPDEGISFLGFSFFRSLKEVPPSAYSIDNADPAPKSEKPAPHEQKVVDKPIARNTSAKPTPPVKHERTKVLAQKPAPLNDSLHEATQVVYAVNKVITFQSVRFVLSKDVLLEGSHKELDALSVYLKNHPRLNVKIIGHTDYEGNWTANYKLSRQRASVVAEYLKKNGITEDRIIVEAMGPSKPVIIDDKPENREENRRVEFMLITESD